jgi:hypothetical protein
MKNKLLTKSINDNWRFLFFDFKHIIWFVDVCWCFMNPFDFDFISKMIIWLNILSLQQTESGNRSTHQSKSKHRLKCSYIFHFLMDNTSNNLNMSYFLSQSIGLIRFDQNYLKLKMLKNVLIMNKNS